MELELYMLDLYDDYKIAVNVPAFYIDRANSIGVKLIEFT